MADLERTQDGFRFGAMTVIAMAAIERKAGKGQYTIIKISTEAGQEIEVYCSPTGRKLRVFRKGWGEMTGHGS